MSEEDSCRCLWLVSEIIERMPIGLKQKKINFILIKPKSSFTENPERNTFFKMQRPHTPKYL